MPNATQMDLSFPYPPEDFASSLKALWWLKKGNLGLGQEWEAAHNICQGAEGDPVHDWIHALCHLIEGDAGNAAYWFRRAGKPRTSSEPRVVWEEIAAALR
ncbi:hypothetical protein [Roseibium sp. Sym1]|uniref:hypothetical protein n=1 Tax=Roseibium sp. Sym1 TaxID=3016006 RepID=UPI0022B30CE6|nr:hypothetical protein [Roseibium sp. Sym1]